MVVGVVVAAVVAKSRGREKENEQHYCTYPVRFRGAVVRIKCPTQAREPMHCFFLPGPAAAAAAAAEVAAAVAATAAAAAVVAAAADAERFMDAGVATVLSYHYMVTW